MAVLAVPRSISPMSSLGVSSLLDIIWGEESSSTIPLSTTFLTGQPKFPCCGEGFADSFSGAI